MAGCLNDRPRRIKYTRKGTKSKIYKATVLQNMAYALETRTDILRTRLMLETNQVKVLRKIVGKKDRIRSRRIRKSCGK